ncbi:MAG: glycosyltransferase [Candidatus Thiodiazotropha sp.]
MNRALWITWENQRRNKTLSKALGLELYQLELNAHRIFRYPGLLIKTFWLYLKKNPKYIFSQNPSIILASFTVLYGLAFNKKVIVDAHNAGVFPLEGRSKLATAVSRFLFRNSYLTIVTNESLKKYIESCNGRAFVLPDPFPEIAFSEKIELKGKYNFMLICTWAEDEPYEEAIKAFADLDSDWVLYITGNSKGKEKNLSIDIPENVLLTGFISNEYFDNLLHSCDCVIDLTTREDCLVCGAYEAVSAEKPLILSDTTALQNYFKSSAFYTKNTAVALKDTVQSLIVSLPEAIEATRAYRRDQEQQWNDMKDNLLTMLSEG